jgi:hypothetical protein
MKWTTFFYFYRPDPAAGIDLAGIGFVKTATDLL